MTRIGRVGWLVLGLAVSSAGCSKDEKKSPEPAKPAVEKKSEAVAQPEAQQAVPQPPKSLGSIQVPKDNPLTAAKVELGHKLFFDKRLSADGSRACYSCHQNEDGTGGHEPLAIGANDKQLTRHSPVIWNVAYLPVFYWDGRATSLEEQAKGAWAGGNMGVGEENLQKKADEIGVLPEYEKLFEAAFPGEGATPETITKALASYERTLFCGDTAYDRYAAGDKSALTAEQQKGWKVFMTKGNCHSCHTPPFFSDTYLAAGGAYHNAGVGIEGKKPEEVDLGRQGVTKNPSDWAAFKTPSLRNVAKSAPYFHNGSAATLEEAVEFMASGGHKNKNLDPKFTDKKLSAEEVKAVVAFLESLNCEGQLEPPKN